MKSITFHFATMAMILSASLSASAISLDVSNADKWNSGQADGVPFQVKTSDKSPDGAGLSLQTDFSKGDWAQIWQDSKLQLEGVTSIRLHMKLAGKKNRVEIKLVDADGTNFGVRLENLQFDGEWREIRVPYSDFAYFWGGENQTLELNTVVSVWVAVSKMDGGASTIDIDRFDIDVGSGAKPSDASNEPSTASVPVGVDEPSEWKSMKDDGAALDMRKAGGGIELEYGFDKGNWVQVYRVIPADLQGLTGLRLKLRQSGARNRIELKLVDADGTNFGKNFEDVPLSGEWDDRTVAFSELKYLWGGNSDLDLSKMNSIWIAVSRMEGGKGTVGIGGIDLVRGSSAEPAAESPQPTAPAGSKAGYVFDMEKLAMWKVEGADGVKVKAAEAKGESGKAVELQYDMAAGDWLQMRNETPMDLSKTSKVALRYRMTGKRNAVEIKLVDADGTNFGVKLEDIKPDGEWRTLSIPISRFAYFWGGNNEMDWEHTLSIWLAISKIDGGAGTLAVDEIALAP